MQTSPTLIQRLFSRNIIALIVFAILNYTLGVGIVRYQGGTINWSIFTLGILWTVCLLLGYAYIYEYFDLLSPGPLSTTPKTTAEVADSKRQQSILLTIGLALLAISAVFAVFFYRDGYLNSALVLVVFAGLSLGLIQVLPAFRRITAGFHELIAALILTNLIPAAGYLLQVSEFSRLVSMSTFPLTALFLVLLIAYEFPDYARDCRNCYPSLLYKVSWQVGVRMIYILALAAYLLIGLAFLSGLAWRLVWPFLLTSPLAVFVIFQLNQIENGAKPNWKLFTLSATALYLLAGYLIAYSFWTA